MENKEAPPCKDRAFGNSPRVFPGKLETDGRTLSAGSENIRLNDDMGGKKRDTQRGDLKGQTFEKLTEFGPAWKENIG